VTTVEHIERMLANENRIIERAEKEVTIDPPKIRAEHRKEAFEEVLDIFEPVPI